MAHGTDLGIDMLDTLSNRISSFAVLYAKQ